MSALDDILAYYEVKHRQDIERASELHRRGIDPLALMMSDIADKKDDLDELIESICESEMMANHTIHEELLNRKNWNLRLLDKEGRDRPKIYLGVNRLFSNDNLDLCWYPAESGCISGRPIGDWLQWSDERPRSEHPNNRLSYFRHGRELIYNLLETSNRINRRDRAKIAVQAVLGHLRDIQAKLSCHLEVHILSFLYLDPYCSTIYSMRTKKEQADHILSIETRRNEEALLTWEKEHLIKKYNITINELCALADKHSGSAVAVAEELAMISKNPNITHEYIERFAKRLKKHGRMIRL